MVRRIFEVWTRVMVKPEPCCVSLLANQWHCSEYEIFEMAFGNWNRSGMDAAFVQYILEERVPWYVRDYCRKELQKYECVAIKGID